jgi:hypothetical protein
MEKNNRHTYNKKIAFKNQIKFKEIWNGIVNHYKRNVM